MKKKILLLVLVSFMLVGVVSAASLWGSYKGNAVIKVNVDGKQYKTSGVPPVSLNGQVMLPLNILKQFGIAYTYDSKKLTANITKPAQQEPVDISAVRDAPISWMKLYYTILSEYKNLSDIELKLDTHFYYIALVFDDILNNRDPKNHFDTAIASYNYLSSTHKQLESITATNVSWAKENGLDVSDLNKAYDKLGEALGFYDKAEQSLDSYVRMGKIKNYMDDYFYNVDKASKAAADAKIMIQNGYNKYDQLIMTYK